ncbi:MAG: Holliday junction resolvase RuvX [Actinomycetota bacterium]|nr:Holliday junction resolvase RuvX [Actinomycetota bacterium]
MSRRLAVDVGSARIGLAISEGTLALPLETLVADAQATTRIQEIASSRDVDVVYVGLPLNLKGEFTPSTTKAIEFAQLLENVGLVVRLIDERLTTKSAQNMLRKAGKKVKESREYIDAQAAALILDFALSSERGNLAGMTLNDIADR